MITVNVKQLRERLGLSQRAFADLVGVDQATVCRYERGRTVPKPVMTILAQMATSLQAGTRPIPTPAAEQFQPEPAE